MSSTDHEISLSFGVVGRSRGRPRAAPRRRHGGPLAPLGELSRTIIDSVADYHEIDRTRRRDRLRGDEARRARSDGGRDDRRIDRLAPTRYDEVRRVPPHRRPRRCATSWSRSTCGSPSSSPGASRTAASRSTTSARSRWSDCSRRSSASNPTAGCSSRRSRRPTITGELKRHFRDRGWAVRVPRRIQELHLELDRTVNDLSQELGRPPTPAEIAQRAGVLEEDVLESMEAGSLYRLASIDAGRADDESAPSPAQRLGEIDAELDRGRRPRRGERDARGAARARAEDRLPAVLRGPDAVGDRRARSASARCTSRGCSCGASRRSASTRPWWRSSDAWTTTCPGSW